LGERWLTEELMPKTSTKLAVWAWVLYDFANTIFSTSILTVFFPLWVDREIGDGAWLVNLATAVSALLVFFTAPVLGALADLRQRRVPYLVALIVISILFTAALDVAGGVAVGVALFVAADLTYQSAIVFYNALLPVVAAWRGAGKISGYGTAAGYVGTILALIFLTFFVSDAETVRSILGPFGGWMETGGEDSLAL
jgi:UMF1 family MFS transporter